MINQFTLEIDDIRRAEGSQHSEEAVSPLRSRPLGREVNSFATPSSHSMSRMDSEAPYASGSGLASVILALFSPVELLKSHTHFHLLAPYDEVLNVSTMLYTPGKHVHLWLRVTSCTLRAYIVVDLHVMSRHTEGWLGLVSLRRGLQGPALFQMHGGDFRLREYLNCSLEWMYGL